MGYKTISLVLSVCCAHALYAADSQEIKLERVTLHDTNDYGSNTKVSIQTLEKIQAKDMADIFSKESSLSVGGGAINAQRLYLRGIESSNLNITIDGARQGTNLHQHRGNIMGIDPDLLKSVEINTAPSAQNGAGALGGSISMTTKDAQDLRMGDESVGAIVRANYSSVSDAERGGTTLYGVYNKHFGAYAHISAENRNNYKQGGGEETLASAYRNRDYFAKFSMLDYLDHSLRLSAEQNTNEGAAKYGSIGSDMGPYIGDGSDLDMQISTRKGYTLEHQYNPNNNWIDLKTNLYSNNTSLENETRQSENINEDIGVRIQNKMLFSLAQSSTVFIVGVDHFSQDGISKYSDGTQVKNNSNNTGVFTQNTTTLYGLDIHYGARFESFEVEFGPRTFSAEEFSPNAGLAYTIYEDLLVYANYGEAIRATGIIPVGWLSSIGETTNFNDGEAFRPESSTQTEFGLKYKQKNLLSDNDLFSFDANYFQTTLTDTIERVGGGRSVTEAGDASKIWNNPEEIETKGYELKLAWQNPKTYLGFSFTHVDTSSDAEQIDVVRRKASRVGDTAVLNAEYQLTKEISLGYIFKALKGLDDILTQTVSEGGAVTTVSQTPRAGYTTHDLQFSFEPLSLEGFDFSLAINNIANKKYALHTSMYGSGNVIYEAGRDLRIGMKYQF